MSDLKRINSDIDIVSKIDSDQLDAFSNLRTAAPSFVADGQLTYDLQPLIYEPIISADGAITHDATNRCASVALTTAADGEETYLQSYAYYRYQAGRAQEIFLTGAASALTTNTEAFFRYGDDNNAVEYATNGTLAGCKWIIRSDTANGDQTVTQANWNLDIMDGTGPSGIVLDPSQTQIMVISIQALYVGAVRVGFDIDGDIVWVHRFNHANEISVPYIQTANLPVAAGIRATGASATGTMRFVCSCVLSRGGQDNIAGYDFCNEGTVTAGSGTRTHLMSIRPKTTFNSLSNRIEFVFEDFDMLVTGTNPVYWELGLGHTLTTPSWTNANSSFSGFEFDETGTLDDAPLIVFASGYCSASSQVKSSITRELKSRYPISLNAAGAVRDLGTLGLFVTGIGGTSDCRAQMHWRELR